MTIEIPAPTGAADVAEEIRASILEAIPDANVEVVPGGPGHFQIHVEAQAFRDKNRVRQQQMVYAAITHLMSGPNPPVHAVDRLDCVVPQKE